MPRTSLPTRSALARLLLAGLASTIAAAPALAAQDISGMWQIRLSKHAGAPGDAQSNASLPKLTPAGQAWVDRRKAAGKQGYVRNIANMKCLPTGFPELMQWRSPIMIMQGFGRVAIITEHDPGSDEPRTIYLNRGHPDPIDGSWNGDSIGHWDGETLVVDTIGFNGRTNAGFAPMTEHTKASERISLSNDGKTLTDAMTLTDPSIFVQPYTITWTYDRMPDTAERMEAVCEPDLDAIAAVDLQKAKDIDLEAARMLDPNAKYNADGNAALGSTTFIHKP